MTDYSFNDSLTTPQQTSLTNIIHDITTMLLVLTEEATLYQSQVQETRSNSTNIQLVLERVSNITPTIIKDSHGYRMNLINVVDTTAEMCKLFLLLLLLFVVTVIFLHRHINHCYQYY